MAFKEVEANPNYVQLEHEMWEYWKEHHILEKYLKKNQGAKEKFFFLDGPVTANNPLGVHHGWGRTLKDLYQRFYNMMGYEERFQNGFDCQGLWVEVEVEKELGFKTKKDIEKYGIDKFVNKCKERVMKFSQIQADQSKRLGYFMDWDHSYYTMNDENNYMIWYFLKVCQERGWLYKGWDSVPWCPRCGTAISQHEILTEEYKNISHESVFVRFPLKNQRFGENTVLLIWTTTPWTLAANVAVAIHPELKYSIYLDKETNERYIFIDNTETSEMLFLEGYLNFEKFKKEKTVQGEDLLGLEYTGPFDDLPAVQKARKEKPERFHTIFPYKELVNANEGTGLVHIAPGCGKEDYDLSVRENLAQIVPIDGAANYVSDFGFLSNKNVKEVNELIFASLKEKGLLYKVQKYKHRYPTCWRCKQELVFRLVEEWYIAMDRVSKKHENMKTRNQKDVGTEDLQSEKNRMESLTLRQQMIEVAKKIRWIPEFGLDRELDWLNNMHDWLISKKRYWGLALPFWKCDACGEVMVIGSKEELKEKAIEGWKDFEGNSPHRPWIDKVKVKCPKCGGKSTRILDVGNPWLDAGIVPFSTLIDPKTGKISYTTNRKYFEKWFPADLVLECFPGQFKNWFYSMIAMSTVLEKSNPYVTLLGHGVVHDEHGEEMHKSKGNAIWFDDAAEKMGVDVMRWMYSLQPTPLNMKFGFRIADETRRRFHLIIWNVYKFFVTYSNLDEWEIQRPQTTDHRLQKKDKQLSSVDLPRRQAGRCLLTVLDKWILERLDQTVYRSTEAIKKYQAYSAAMEIESFVQDLSTWYLRRSRKRVGPTVSDIDDKNAFYATMHQVLLVLMRLIAPFNPYFTDKIYQNLSGEESVHLSSWPVVKKEDVSEELSKKMELVRQIVEKGHAIRKDKGLKVRQPLNNVKIKNPASSAGRENEKLNSELEELIKEELNVKDVVYQEGKGELEVELDLIITEELKQEGMMRGIVRMIQDLRKEAGCQFNDGIIVYYMAEGKVLTVIQKFTKEIEKQVLAKKFVKSIEQKEKYIGKENKIDGEDLWVGIEKVTI